MINILSSECNDTHSKKCRGDLGDIYLFKVNKTNTRKLNNKDTRMKVALLCLRAFVITFEYISHLSLALL